METPAEHSERKELDQVKLKQAEPDPSMLTFTQLAGMAASGQDVWVLALLAQAREAGTDATLRREFLDSCYRNLPRASPEELRTPALAQLLDRISACDPTLARPVLYMLCRRSAGTLTLAHMHLVELLGPSTERFSDVLFDEMPLEFALVGDRTRLKRYFRHATTLLVTYKMYDKAAVHARCALAVCTTRDDRPRLAARAQLLELLAFQHSSGPLPKFLLTLMDIGPPSPPLKKAVAAFASVGQRASNLAAYRDIAPVLDSLCEQLELDVAQPLKDALQIAWLDSLHTCMPTFTHEEAAQSGPKPPSELAAYRGTIDAARGTYTKPAMTPQWATLETVLKVTTALKDTEALVMHTRAELYDDEICF